MREISIKLILLKGGKIVRTEENSHTSAGVVALVVGLRSVRPEKVKIRETGVVSIIQPGFT